jgi:hypothetical protein
MLARQAASSGRFDRTAQSFLGHRDHQASLPWSVTALHAMIVP